MSTMLPVRRHTTDRPARTNGQFDPLAELDRVTSGMARLLDTMALPDGTWPGGAMDLLADLEETDDAFIAEVELPGVSRDDVDVEIEGRRLVVTADRKERERTGVLRRRTRHVGSMRHEVLLPADVEEDQITASLADGVLTVTLPKTARARRKSITVG